MGAKLEGQVHFGKFSLLCLGLHIDELRTYMHTYTHPKTKQQWALHYSAKYRILSKNSSLALSRKIRHLVAIRIGMNKMATDDEYLDYCDETLERAAKPWSDLLGAFLETKCWV